MTSLEAAVDEVLRGNTAAFQRVVDATSTRLVRLSARILGSVIDAEDVVQDAYVKAYRSLVDGQFDRRSTIETWLYRIVVNGSIDAKRRRRHAASADDEAVAAAWDTRASAEERVALQELAAWIDELPEEQQAVLVMKAIEGLSSAEIAGILRCSEGAVEQRLVRARAALRDRRRGHEG